MQHGYCDCSIEIEIKTQTSCLPKTIYYLPILFITNSNFAMKRLDLIKGFYEDLGVFDPIRKIMIDFVNDNTEIPDTLFYEKFAEKFPWVDYAIKRKQTKCLRSIDNSLTFFKILTIISIIVALIVAVNSTS